MEQIRSANAKAEEAERRTAQILLEAEQRIREVQERADQLQQQVMPVYSNENGTGTFNNQNDSGNVDPAEEEMDLEDPEDEMPEVLRNCRMGKVPGETTEENIERLIFFDWIVQNFVREIKEVYPEFDRWEEAAPGLRRRFNEMNKKYLARKQFWIEMEMFVKGHWNGTTFKELPNDWLREEMPEESDWTDYQQMKSGDNDQQEEL